MLFCFFWENRRTAITIPAIKIASEILRTGDASNYLKFLTTGGSDYPINELKIAGVDLTKPDTVRDAMKIFDETVDELAKLI